MTKEKNPDSASRTVTSIALLSFTAILLIALALFPGRIQEPLPTATALVVGLLAYLALTRVMQRARNAALKSLVAVVAVISLTGILFGKVLHFQQLLYTHWFDDELIALELRILGFEGSLGSQPFVSPALTEWMMFSYVIYIPLLPAVAWMSYRAGGQEQVHQYLCALAVSYLCCYVGFVLYPVASPLYHFPEKFTVPLEGGPFTWAGEWIRAHAHEKGGSLPSPHCAAGTVILVFAWKYKRWWGIALTPVILSLYVSTVYGRYHYTSDAITGIITAVLVLVFAPRVVQLVERRQRRTDLPRVEQSNSEF